MAIINDKPTAIITGYNDETFDTENEALECAKWLENENGEAGGDLYVFEKDDRWVVAG